RLERLRLATIAWCRQERVREPARNDLLSTVVVRVTEDGVVRACVIRHAGDEDADRDELRRRRLRAAALRLEPSTRRGEACHVRGEAPREYLLGRDTGNGEGFLDVARIERCRLASSLRL